MGDMDSGGDPGRGAGVIRPVAAGLGLLLLASCSPAEQVRACATLDRPPIVVADPQCAAPGVQWYSAPASDIGPDDQPVVGQELDGDFWDLSDQLDLDGHRAKSTSKAPRTTAKATTKTRSTTAKRVSS